MNRLIQRDDMASAASQVFRPVLDHKIQTCVTHSAAAAASTVYCREGHQQSNYGNSSQVRYEEYK